MGASFALVNPLRVLFDRTTLVVLLTVTLIDAYTVFRAHEAALRAKYFPSSSSSSAASASQSRFVAAHVQSIDGRWMWCLPLIAACTLVGLFFLMPYIGTVLVLFTALAGAIGLTFVLLPFATFLSHRLPSFNTSNNISVYFAGAVAGAAVLAWFYTGNYMLNNLLGFSLCVLFGVIGRIRSFRSLVILFVGLYVYDIFFVFFSPYFFRGKNVMVQVATTAPNNPAYLLSNFLRLPFKPPVKRLALPSKLIFPNNHSYSMIGLGDIVLPIVLLVYLVGVDLDTNINHGSKYPTFFIRALLGHMLGLFMSFYCNIAFQAPQPALFYIVPSMLLLTAYTAHKKRLLTTLWNEVPNNNSINRRGYQELPDSTVSISPDKDTNDDT